MKKFITIFFILIAIIFNVNNITYADAITPSDITNQIYNTTEINNNEFSNMGAKIAGYIIWVAIIISVIVLMSKGIKFITSAPEGKAEVKKELMPWAIGLIILFSMNVVIRFVVNFAQNNINNLTV